MLKNYFKIAIAVLRRRKFFTFISLFGISFTLTILLVLTAFIDKVISNTYPDRKRDRSLYINNVDEKGKNDMSSSAPSYYFLKHFAGSLKTPVEQTIFSRYSGTNTYINNKKIAVNYKYTDENYWDILEYDFIEGKPYTQKQVDDADHVAVISEDMKNEYFGDDVPSVVGKYIEADNVKYRVTGVVKNIPITTYMLYSDIYLPYTVSKTDYKGKGYLGSSISILLAKSSADLPKIQQEYEQVVRRIPMESKNFNKLYSHAESYMASYVNTGNEDTPGVTLVLTVISVFIFLFLLLPTLNLVNINITRIMERSSEIGVRKAFGASSRTLVYQFIVENIILTLLGGIIGVVLTFIILQFINSLNLIANLELTINFTVLFFGLLTCVFFGLLSGVYPAWRMSRLNVVTALKAQ